MKSLHLESNFYRFPLSIVFLCLLNTLAVARGVDAQRHKVQQVETLAQPKLQSTSSRFLVQVPTTQPLRKKPTRSKPSELETRVLVSEVVVSGVEGKLEDIVYKNIRLQPGRTTTRSQLQEDINSIFSTGFFSNVQAVPEDTPLGVRVSFIVRPNPILNKVQVQANPGTNIPSVIPASTVDSIFRKHYGKILNLWELQERIKELTKRYQDQGYVLANVIGSPQVAPTGVVTLQVAEGVVENIRVRFINNEKKGTHEGSPLLRVISFIYLLGECSSVKIV